MNEKSKREDEIGALWHKTSHNGTKYMDGKVNGESVVAFFNLPENKKNPREPDLRIKRSRKQQQFTPPPPRDDEDMPW